MTRVTRKRMDIPGVPFPIIVNPGMPSNQIVLANDKECVVADVETGAMCHFRFLQAMTFPPSKDRR